MSLILRRLLWAVLASFAFDIFSAVLGDLASWWDVKFENGFFAAMVVSYVCRGVWWVGDE